MQVIQRGSSPWSPIRRLRSFFTLQDLTTDDCCAVRFFMPFDDFNTPSVPRDGDAYKEYRHLSIEFIEVGTTGSAEAMPFALMSSDEVSVSGRLLAVRSPQSLRFARSESSFFVLDVT